MDQVYSNSLLSIGAATAMNQFQGLFSSKNGGDFSSVHVQWRPNLSDKKTWYRMWKDTSKCPLKVAFSGLNKSQLSTRGWAVQELVLSRRMLSFDGPRVFWQYSEIATCEDYPYDNSESIYWASYHPFWALVDPTVLLGANRQAEPNDKQRTFHVNGQQYNGSVQERWFGAMDSYCKASLTSPDKDVFKAFEGAGQRAAQFAGDAYQHGLSRSTLPQALMWRARDNMCRRSPPHRAPSWHWASYESHVEFGNTKKLNVEARKQHESLAPLAYLFLSDDCKIFVARHHTGSWPSLMCIGKLILHEMKAREHSRHATRRGGM